MVHLPFSSYSLSFYAPSFVSFLTRGNILMNELYFFCSPTITMPLSFSVLTINHLQFNAVIFQFLKKRSSCFQMQFLQRSKTKKNQRTDQRYYIATYCFFFVLRDSCVETSRRTTENSSQFLWMIVVKERELFSTCSVTNPNFHSLSFTTLENR